MVAPAITNNVSNKTLICKKSYREIYIKLLTDDVVSLFLV